MANPEGNIETTEKQRDNLVSLADRTPEERAEIARMGGIASGEAKREKKVMSEKLAAYFEHKDLESYFDAMMERKDNVTMALLKEAREAIEGSKIKMDGAIIINIDNDDNTL